MQDVTRLAVLGLLGGVALTTLLVLSHGFSGIWQAAVALGLAGFSLVVMFHILLIGLMGLAWWLLRTSGAPWLRFAWGRLIRDSASEALPLSQVGGYVLGARALALAGSSAAFAAGSTVVDVTVELVAQLGYTLLGVALLRRLDPGNTLAGPILGAVGVMAVLVVLFIAVQARGAAWVERIGTRVAGHLLGRQLGASGEVRQVIDDVHAQPGRLLSAGSVHLTAWVLSGVETWLTLLFMGKPVSLAAALVVDSLLYGIRSLAFMVPNAFGVQEGALIVVCSLFGVGPDAALALSFIKRGRDLVIGVPALLVWQGLEGRRAWRGLTLAPGNDTAIPSGARD
jgi:putative membrane protein